jgi:hypothetical protein
MVFPQPERVFESAETECSYFLSLVQSRGPIVLIANTPNMPQFCAPFFQPLCTGFPGHQGGRDL